MKEVTIERITVPWYMQYILVVLKEKDTSDPYWGFHAEGKNQEDLQKRVNEIRETKK